MAHARRKFKEVIDSASKGADIQNSFSNQILVLMKDLFHLETKTTNMSYDEILKYRQDKSKPIFDEMMERIHEANNAKILNQKLAEAITYAINQESKLRTYLDDGRIEISNNALERAIRPLAVGRKNWLFVSTPHGANTSSCYYSIVETAKLNNLNPRNYLEYLLEKVPAMNLKDDQDLERIMPWSKELPKYLYMDKKS